MTRPRQFLDPDRKTLRDWKWPVEYDDLVRKHWPDLGMTQADIGKLIGKSGNAVGGRAHRLGLGERGMYGEKNGFWTDEKMAALEKLWPTKLSTREIGRELGCTGSCVTGKAHRMQLPRRQECVTKRYMPIAVQEKNHRRPEHQVMGEAIKTIIPLPAPSQVVSEPMYGRIEPCCWVNANGTYCDEPTVPRKSMCEKHRAIAIRPSEPPRQYIPNQPSYRQTNFYGEQLPDVG